MLITDVPQQRPALGSPEIRWSFLLVRITSVGRVDRPRDNCSGGRFVGIMRGKVDFRLTGDWKIGALTLQPILYETEDFLFDRPFWNMEVVTPDAGQERAM